MADEKKSLGERFKRLWFEEPSGPQPVAPAKPPSGNRAPAPKGSGKSNADAVADDLIRRYAGGSPAVGTGPAPAHMPLRPPGLDRSPARSPSGEVPPDFGGSAPRPAGDGAVDFVGVFRKAGISPEEGDRVEKALALLGQLPAETPQPVKKQIVETSLKTFGVPVDSIIETAVAEIEALQGAIKAGEGEMNGLFGDSEKRIADLEKQIADVRQVMEARKHEQTSLEQQARALGLRIQQILEFFGRDKVEQVMSDSPRLKDKPDG